jgi:hypothetical protein
MKYICVRVDIKLKVNVLDNQLHTKNSDETKTCNKTHEV